MHVLVLASAHQAPGDLFSVHPVHRKFSPSCDTFKSRFPCGDSSQASSTGEATTTRCWGRASQTPERPATAILLPLFPAHPWALLRAVRFLFRATAFAPVLEIVIGAHKALSHPQSSCHSHRHTFQVELLTFPPPGGTVSSQSRLIAASN